MEDYAELYSIAFLDDIHNLFPEVLYDNYIFPPDTEANRLICWLRFRVSRLFPQTFRNARLQYERLRAERSRAEFDDWQFMRQRARPSIISASLRNTLLNPLDTALLFELDPIIMPRVRRSTRFPLDSAWVSTCLESIPIYASSEQIEAGTEIIDVSDLSGDVICAICQEHEGSSTWRRLRQCSHLFHRNCIDNWFGRNAHCPVCRSDIRQHTQTHPDAEATGVETPPVSLPSHTEP